MAERALTAPRGPPPAPDAAELTILGAGTLVPDAARHSAAHHLRLEAASILIDCGPGTVHGFALQGVPWNDLTHIVVSHYHNDHVGDLGAVLFALKHGPNPPRKAPLTLMGPAGFRDFLGRLAGALGDHVVDPGFELRVVEMAPGRPFPDPRCGFTLACHPTPHTAESLAFRLEGTWGTVGYTGDTGPSEAVAGFLEGCDVLVAECTLPDGAAVETHLSPASLAALARAAQPGLLVVVHVGPLHSPEEVERRVRALHDGPTVAAFDGLRVRLVEGASSVDWLLGPA